MCECVIVAIVFVYVAGDGDGDVNSCVSTDNSGSYSLTQFLLLIQRRQTNAQIYPFVLLLAYQNINMQINYELYILVIPRASERKTDKNVLKKKKKKKQNAVHIILRQQITAQKRFKNKFKKYQWEHIRYMYTIHMCADTNIDCWSFFSMNT